MVAVSPTVVVAVVDSIEAFARDMLANNGTGKRQELEARVLAAALKQSVERGDRNGALLAYKHLGMLMRQIIDATQQSQEITHQNHKANREGPAAQPTPALAPETPAPPPPIDTQMDFAPPADAAPAVETVAETPAEAPPVETAAAAPVETPPLETPPMETPAPPRPTLELAIIPDGSDYYRLLGCDRMATFDQIQIGFFRKLRSVLLGTQPMTRDSKQMLRAVCIAHDVLKEPTTRTDYDFRLLGVRDDNQVQTPEDARPAGFGSRTHIKIGELLQCAQILEASELEIAVDMHKAMPEMRFGEFLVKQGFLERRQLEAALLGQFLISNGKITVAQYQVGMYNERNSSVPLAETITSAGWVTDEDLQAYQQPALPNTTTLIPPMPPPVVRPSQEQPIPTQLSAASAVPSWAGNIWGDDEGKEEGEPRAAEVQASQAGRMPALPGSAQEVPALPGSAEVEQAFSGAAEVEQALPGSAGEEQALPGADEEDQTKTRPIPVIVNEPLPPPHEDTKKGRKQRGRARDLQPLTGGLTEETGSNSKKRRGNKNAKSTVNPNEFEPIIGQLQEETREEDRE